jgi:hypothetical protein
VSAFLWPLGSDDFEVEAVLLAPEVEGYDDEGLPLYGKPSAELTVYALSLDAEARVLNDWEMGDWLAAHGAAAEAHAIEAAIDEAVHAAEMRAEG